jgi:hypothetical protein
LGDIWAARAAYENGLEIDRVRAEADPLNIQAQTDLAVSHYKVGRLEQAALQHAEAVPFYQRSLTILRRLLAEGKLQDQPEYSQWVKTLEDVIAQCQAAHCSAIRVDGPFPIEIP